MSDLLVLRHLFFISLVVGLLLSETLGSLLGRWFCCLAAILMQQWEEPGATLTYLCSHLDQKGLTVLFFVTGENTEISYSYLACLRARGRQNPSRSPRPPDHLRTVAPLPIPPVFPPPHVLPTALAAGPDRHSSSGSDVM